MLIEINRYKNLKSQTVNVDSGLTVLVGTNGSGKSSFLEYLFLNNNFENSIVYSSGINESFSPKYREYLGSLYRSARKSMFSEQLENEDDVDVENKFYFSKEWASFLILVASYLAKDSSNITKWMNHFGLRVASFDFQIYLPFQFRKDLKLNYEKLEQGRLDYGFESSRVVKFLSSLVDDDINMLMAEPKIQISWGSLENLEPNPRSLMNVIIFTQLFESSLFAKNEETKTTISKFFKMLQVLSTGGSRSRFIPLENSKLTFSKGHVTLGLDDLSDGEFQILLNSALLDLFDGDNSLFLLDEVDAHIHPTIINDVWSSFEDIRGHAFTTSHNLLTISNSDYNRIIFLEDGTVISDTSKKAELVNDVCGTMFGAPIWKTLLYSVENLVLIDGLGDWEIYKELISKLGLDSDLLEYRTLVIEKSSGTDRDNRENLLRAKVIFVEEMFDIAKKSKFSSEEIKLKNIFLLCDSDSYICTNDGLDYKKLNLNRSRGVNVHSLVWNRRNIESYLISPQARLHYDDSETNEFTWGELESFGDLPESSLNDTNIKRVDSKHVVRRFIGNDSFDSDRVREYISRMNLEDVDPYLRLVFDKIVALKSVTIG